MKIVLDSSALVYLSDPTASAPIDPATGKPVAHCQERIEGLLEDMDDSGAHLILPTPVLSEVLIREQTRRAEALAVLSNSKAIQIVPFDVQAAVENAALRRGKLSRKARGETKKEVSFDLQIMAIARVVNADLVLTDDDQLRKRCEKAGMRVIGIADLPVPDSKRQMAFFGAKVEGALEGDVSEPGLEDAKNHDQD